MLAILLLCLAGAPKDAPPAPHRWVTDSAGLLSSPANEALDRKLEALQRASGHQVLVWIGGSTGSEPIEQFAERTFKAWKVGRAGLDDGVVLFVFPADRALRIEVGYGLEPVLPDAVCARIIREKIAPLLAAGQPDAAITAGVDGMLAAISKQTPEAAPTAGPRSITLAQWILGGLALLGFLVLLAVRPDLAMALLWALSMGRRGGRGGSGGFSGGGGRSGGGGASGRW